ncbi:4-methylaminobutanoate oxidase (formaldehyde-forming) [Nakamurella panacisegetis]|uniref:4-methylaminobutanoate oxidase (Formaldehyde-forming) n=1 Tax=Nakamurella panacisegetis TaxID=1090615 RepID=A0A1H0JBE1_9ACTN|nr:FAD-dependent oxidoreductase [Nakamurella panacisegetis]SDO40964.1 4-methylaminobutanoate oxidase (formaldehyde-forming) [Nakamurella panacisegetis]
MTTIGRTQVRQPSLPARARVVVIGGGVGGASIAYHLAELGERDVLLLDRGELTSGSTFHSAGLVGQLRSDPTLTRMNMYSVELYRKLQRSDAPPSWVESGSIRLASSPERLLELRRQLAWANVFGLPMEEISAARAQELFPLMSTDGVLGGVYLPSDGQVDPSQLCYSLAAGARAGGVQIVQQVRVTGIVVDGGRVRGVRTDGGDVEAEIVVNCGGIYAAEIGRLAGLRIPVVPMSHQYVVTEPMSGVPEPGGPVLPSLRDPDLLVYYRQEGRGLLMGGYERNPLPFTADATHYDRVPADFNAKLLPDDWDRFTEIADNSAIRVPAMGDARIRRLINGPEAFTHDNEFCLGQTEVDGLFVSAGFCAHGIAGAGGVGKLMAEWIVSGEPSMEVAHMDINRFGRQYTSPSFTLKRVLENYRTYYDIRYPGDERQAGRPLRRSPAYAWHVAHGASFGEKSGWERVNFYASNEAAGDRLARPKGWAGQNFSPAVSAEHRAARESVAMFDQSSFSKITVTGPDAAKFLEWVCDNKVARGVGRVTYTQMLNHRGGIEADVTVTRLGPETFWVVTGTAFGSRDGAWLRRQARAGASGATGDGTGASGATGDVSGASGATPRPFDVTITDVSGGYVCFAVWGPRARDLLATLTAADLSHTAFPFMTSQELPVGDIPLRAQRVTFVGELGWELYAPAEYGATLWELLWDAGAEFGIRAAGYRAIESLRLEKAYRVWGADITGETDPLSAGLGFCVSWDKEFLGREAVERVRTAGPSRKLCCLTLDDPSRLVLGGEPVRINGELAGRVTSGGFGYTVGRSIAFAYLPVALTIPGTRLEVDLFGEWLSGQVADDVLHDPSGANIRR